MEAVIDGFCDGLSSTMLSEQLREALGESSEKLHDGEGLVTALVAKGLAFGERGHEGTL